MKIKQINISGFKRVFEAYQTAFKEKMKGFGSGLFDYLSHSMISLELQEITTIELFYLKKIASDIIVIDKEYSNFTSEKNEFDINQKVEGLLTLHDEMLNDEDINKNTSYIDNILPIGCERYHIIAIFKGSNITSITTPFVEKVFYVDGKFPTSYSGNFLIENTIAELFFKNFYDYMSKQVTDLDLLSEFMTNKKFYQYADNICNIAYVNSPHGELVFFGNSQDVLNRQIDSIRKSQETSPYVLRDNTMITYVMNTTFSTFMKLFLNTNYVVDHQNLKLVFVDESIDISEKILNKYEARLSNYADYLISYKKGLNEDTNINLNKFNFIFNGSKIVYSLQIPISDIIDKDKLDFMFGEEEEWTNIENSIISTAKMVDSLIG